MANIQGFEKEPMKNTMSDKTRYIIVGCVTGILIVLIVGLLIFGNNDGNKSDTNSESSSTSKNTSTEALKEFYDEFESKDLNVIIFARESCSFCQLQKPILLQVAKDYDMPYYLLNTDALSNEENTEIMKALGNTKGSTPITYVVKDGKIIDETDGFLDGKAYVDFLKTNGVLPEDAVYSQETELVDISYSKFEDIVKSKKKTVVLLDTYGSRVCVQVRSILQEVAKENKIKINYINPYGLSQDDINDLVSNKFKELGYKEESYVNNSEIKVPLLFVIENNKIKDYIIESTGEDNDKADYEKFLKKNGIIK